MRLGKEKKRSKSQILGPETERYVPLDFQEKTAESRGYKRSRGQAILIVALMMTVLVLFVGLGVDVGNLMGKRAKLQSAVDAAALSAAQLLADSSVSTNTVTTKAYQIIEANGVPSGTLSSRQVTVTIITSQVRVQAVQRVDTFFMRIIPAFRQMEIGADSTADLNSYAEINIKPYGIAGVVNELNISVWGPDSWRTGGDAYAPQYVSGNTVNPENAKMPYGYLYRIDVPSNFSDDHLIVQLFDPDTYNRPDSPPTPYTPAPTSTTLAGTKTSTPVPSPTFSSYDGRFTWCAYNVSANCTTWLVDKPTPTPPGTNQRYNTGLNLNGYPINSTTTPMPTVWAGRKRVAFWRVDEFRKDRLDTGIGPSGTQWQDSWATTTNFSLWHFDPHITSAFDNPYNLSDQPGGTYVATYTVGMDSRTDLAWYQPPGFDITLNDPSCTGSNNDCFARESNGNFYFYIYVKTTSGSSENNFDIRVGPKDTNYTPFPATGFSYNCSTLPPSGICKANEQYFQQTNNANPPPDWDAGGGSPAFVFAKRALPLNLDTGSNFPMLFTQVSKNAAGQTLAVRHFDQDCTGGGGGNCGPSLTMQYQMQLCVNAGTTNLCSTGNCEPCRDTLNPACFGNVATGWVGPGNGWYCPDSFAVGCNGWTTPDRPEKVAIPVEGTTGYTQFFGPGGVCPSSWLRLQSDPSYNQDTTVWEMPFARPRLIK